MNTKRLNGYYIVYGWKTLVEKSIKNECKGRTIRLHFDDGGFFTSFMDDHIWDKKRIINIKDGLWRKDCINRTFRVTHCMIEKEVSKEEAIASWEQTVRNIDWLL